MPANPEANPIFCIVGPTGCGKSAAAMMVASELREAEIVAADRYTAWAEMDIGTAKPTSADREKAAHHLLDIFHLGSLAGRDMGPAYKTPDHDNIPSLSALARTAFSAINDRDGIALAVGGSPIMLAALRNNLKHRPNPRWREAVAAMSDQELYDFCASWDLAFDYEGSPESIRPKLIWEFETFGRKPLPNVLTLGIHPMGRSMAGKMLGRINQMWEEGLPDEVERLVETYGWVAPLKRAIGYKEFRAEGGQGIGNHSKAREEIIANTIAYAWNQSIAFNKLGNSILWLDSAEAVARAIISYTRHYREIGEQPAAWTKNMLASGLYGPR